MDNLQTGKIAKQVNIVKSKEDGRFHPPEAVKLIKNNVGEV